MDLLWRSKDVGVLAELQDRTPSTDDVIVDFQRELCHIVDWEDVPRALRERLVGADEILQHGGHPPVHADGPAAIFPSVDDPHWTRFHHSLSWAVPVPTAWTPYWSDRTISEMEALSRGRHSLSQSLRVKDVNAFKQAIVSLGDAGLREPIAFRGKAWVGTSVSSGGRVIFPPPEQAERRVAEIVDFLSSHHFPSAVFGATVAKVLFTNSHPLRDGNGRVSRVLFNYVLAGNIGCAGYVPVKEYMSVCWGALQIAMRTAETRGDWQPILSLMCDIIEDWVLRNPTRTGKPSASS